VIYTKVSSAVAPCTQRQVVAVGTPIQNEVGAFLANPLLSGILTQARSAVDLRLFEQNREKCNEAGVGLVRASRRGKWSC